MAHPERATSLNSASALILFAVMAGAPLPGASREFIVVAAWCFLLGLGVLLASPRHLRRGHLAMLAGVAFVAACYGLVLHEQLAEKPWFAAPHPIWAKAAELLGRAVPPSPAVIRGEAFFAVGPSLACLLALVLGLLVGADGHRARQALLVLGWSGVGYALYGMALMAGSGTALVSTFINRNTAAAYLGACALVWLVLFMSALRGRLPRGPIEWGEAVKQLTSDPLRERQIAIRFGLFFVCLTAMFLTASRAGTLVSLLVMVIILGLFFRRDIKRGPTLVLTLVGAGLAAWMLLQFAGAQVEQRIDAAGLTEQGRVETYRATLKLIADNPWFGTGLGTFAWAFPPYRSGDISIWGVWDRAHSTPLELAAELGVPITLLFVAGWIVILGALIKGTTRSRRETIVPFAALGVALIANLHSAIDFSLQIPGFAIVVFALVGIGLGQSFQSDDERGSQERRRHRRRHRSEEAGQHAASDGGP